MKEKQKGNREGVRKSGLKKKKKGKIKRELAAGKENSVLHPPCRGQPWSTGALILKNSQLPLAFPLCPLPGSALWTSTTPLGLQQHTAPCQARCEAGAYSCGKLGPSFPQHGKQSCTACHREILSAGTQLFPLLLQEQTGACCSEGSLQARVKCSLHKTQNKTHTDLQAVICSQR